MGAVSRLKQALKAPASALVRGLLQASPEAFYLLRGAASYLPGYSHSPSEMTVEPARYFYSVWLRHLSLAALRVEGFQLPRVVAELGPGSAIGTGLCALISGAEVYCSFDVVRYADPQRNLRVLEELIELFRARAPIPGPGEFPDARPPLTSYAFPSEVLSEEHLARCLAPARLDAIRAALRGEDSPIQIRYVVPWQGVAELEPESVDFVYSQAVLEHVVDLEDAYAALYAWLRPGGIGSHQIDLKSHELTRHWNGHYGLPRAAWRVMRGRRPWLLNRVSPQGHLDLLEAAGFERVASDRMLGAPGLPRWRLSPSFRDLSDEDLLTDGLFVQVRKPARKPDA